MLNGPTYLRMVIYFWVRVDVYDEVSASVEKYIGNGTKRV